MNFFRGMERLLVELALFITPYLVRLGEPLMRIVFFLFVAKVLKLLNYYYSYCYDFVPSRLLSY